MTVDGYRVFDAHLHVQPWHLLRPPVRELLETVRSKDDLARIQRLQSDPAAVVDFLDAEGVDRAVLVNYVAPDVSGFTEDVNPWVGKFAAAFPDRLVAMGSVHPHRVADPAAAVDELIDVHGVRAFKVHPSHQLFDPAAYLDGDERVRALWARLQERAVPVTVHTGTSVFPGARNRFADPMRLDDVAVDFPDLTLLLAHVGRPFWTGQATFLARRHPNVHLELSGIPPSKLLEYVPDIPKIPEKVLFGTDWPGPGVRSVAGNVRAFLDLPLEEDAKRAILWHNAERVFSGC